MTDIHTDTKMTDDPEWTYTFLTINQINTNTHTVAPKNPSMAC